ncbi:MAG: hypothetical protein M3280_04720 [Actinomycetota bacterium]|nr:hypothetical protein [Actinomycetota bacterium]
MRRALAIAISISALFYLALGGGSTEVVAGPPQNCGITTLDGTIDVSVLEDGLALKCGPGERIRTRDRFAEAEPGRKQRRRPLLSFFSIADVQLADEESPLRGEWADKCEDHPFESAFRPQETMVPHLLNGHIRAANAIAKKGSPVLDDDFDFAIGLGDLADNNQLNELRWIIDIFDGKQLINPDSGDEGYDGVQARDPEGAPEDPLTSPVKGESIIELANEPFWATGLRPDGRLPWYSLPGNHDVKVQGTVPNEAGWRQFAEQWAVGSLKVQDLPPDQQQDACEDPAGNFGDPDWYSNLPDGTTQPVPPDPKRRLLSREDWVQQHFKTTGLPDGHGYDHNRCRTRKGDLLERACYSFTKGRFHFIGVDTNPHEGFEGGNVDRPQFRWLRRELKAHSTKYFKIDGDVVKNENGRNKLIVVFTHHTIGSTDNEETPNAMNGRDLRRLLLRFPNVIMHANGHTHQNKIWGRENREWDHGYWEVNTSAIADLPHQSRTIEIADNRDGTLSIFAVVFNALVAPDPRTIDWKADDPTDEVALGGAEATSNENWFASAATELGFYDPQGDLTRIGRRGDRNVELLLPAPAWFRN